MYLDRVKINIKAGNGGNGHTSFFRSKLTMNGGPDGGDGGKGGDVVFVANQGINSLLGFSYKKKFFATDGLGGQKQFRKGSDGKDVVIEVPCGTVIIDAETNKPIADLTEHGQRFVALSGGAGGRGNTFFKSSIRDNKSSFSIILELIFGFLTFKSFTLETFVKSKDFANKSNFTKISSGNFSPFKRFSECSV